MTLLQPAPVVDAPLLLPGAIRRPLWLGEVLLLGAFYAAYAWIRDAHGRVTDAGVALGHATSVLHAERWAHLDPERWFQWLLPQHGPAVRLVNGFYLLAHVTVTVSVLVFLYVRRPGLYRRCRTALLLVSGIALAAFALWPVAPPRLLPAAHVRDTLVEGGWWSLNHGGIERIADPYAAMPSLHLGWSTWVALSLAAAFAGSARRRLVVLYPTAVAVVVLSTGAHWLADVVAGVLVALAGWWLSGRLPSRRPRTEGDAP